MNTDFQRQQVINGLLEIAYENFWDDFLKAGSKIHNPVPTNPLLLKLNEEEFHSADIKVVIFGQETWCWVEFGTSMETTRNWYCDFFVQENFYDGYGRSAYWKAFRYFKEQIQEMFIGRKCTFIWQNISKIGRNDGETGVTPEIRELERNYLPIIAQELVLLKPDIVLFLTGPNRDHDISFHFPDAIFKPVDDEPSIRRLAKVVAKNLPALSYRTCHPSYYKSFNNQLKQTIMTNIAKDYFHREERRKLTELFGTVEFDPSYDYKKQRKVT